jgi:hypothetical protein
MNYYDNDTLVGGLRGCICNKFGGALGSGLN